MILIGKGADVLYAQEKDGHEEGVHGCRSVLKRPGMVLKLLSLSGWNHIFLFGVKISRGSGKISFCIGTLTMFLSLPALRIQKRSKADRIDI